MSPGSSMNRANANCLSAGTQGKMLRSKLARVSGDAALAHAARAVLELRSGHVLTDAEWARARATLIESVTILRGWEQNAGSNDSVPGAATGARDISAVLITSQEA